MDVEFLVEDLKSSVNGMTGLPEGDDLFAGWRTTGTGSVEHSDHGDLRSKLAYQHL